MKLTNKTSLNDMPFKGEDDDFNTINYVNGLVRFIKNAQAPLTIALQGEWGSGKTSLMNRLEQELCQSANPAFMGITINTWEYSMLASPEETVYNILARLVKEIGKDNSGVKNFFKRISNMAWRGGRELLKGAKIAGQTLPVVGIAVEAINFPTENPLTSDNDDVALSELREALEKAVKQRIKDEKKKGIIVFVDDLDRLNPPVAVEILELLKNVFTLENCIFVLAIDYEVVVKGLEPKFGKLTNQNEREFRSFFDKIIQVPFSLPVNSYQPMRFVMRSLKEIGYLSDNIKLKEEQEALFEEVVKASVGNNPRSIKRLINTLSLLACITKEFEKSESSVNNNDGSLTEYSVREKLLNFIIVAIQICYPRIYTLLEHRPNFTEWDREFAVREGIILPDSMEHDEPSWSDLLEIVCSADKYLSQHYLDISMLFDKIKSILDEYSGKTNENIGKKLVEILNKASVTGVRHNAGVEEFDRKAFIRKLHDNVGRRIHQLRPDIKNFSFKNNTGNGGINFKIDDSQKYEIKFIPDNKDNKITLRLNLSTCIGRSETMIGVPLDKLLEDTRLAKAISAFDAEISPLLQERSFFTSQHSKEDIYFTSYMDELRHHHKEGSMSGDVTHAAEYLITLPKPSDFESEKIIDAVTDAVIANYDFRKIMTSEN